MSTRVAINGLGRIGRAILKLVLDESTFELIAVARPPRRGTQEAGRRGSAT